ncbi:hypothetical protein KSP39_PZI017645 [Platanthera zijinensis]|uniref:Uncharacterized protein n=1 Tax=Platanthera zijinensis TaxID=2320716 RepID=A0AAP0G024_9ASPA
MENQTAGNQPTRRRQPLQLRNTPAHQAMEIQQKPSPTRVKPPVMLSQSASGGKENSGIITAFLSPSGDLPAPADALSLAEELGAARRRNEKLRLERQRTESTLRMRDLVLENGVREAERREVEQREAELKLQQLLRLIQIRPLLRYDRISSLRAQEEEKMREQLVVVSSLMAVLTSNFCRNCSLIL